MHRAVAGVVEGDVALEHGVRQVGFLVEPGLEVQLSGAEDEGAAQGGRGRVREGPRAAVDAAQGETDQAAFRRLLVHAAACRSNNGEFLRFFFFITDEKISCKITLLNFNFLAPKHLLKMFELSI